MPSNPSAPASPAGTLRRSAVAATGAYLPAREVRNEALTMFPAAALPLIEKKTGVRARRYAAPDENTSDLAAHAARDCLRNAGIAADEVDALIVATSSPDRILSATAARVQHLIGAKRAFAFDLNSVCSGAVFAIDLANASIRVGRCRRVLVVAAEIYSRFLNPKDFSTYPYFGDGAGAILLQAATGEEGVQGTLLFTDGAGYDTIKIVAGGSACPLGQMKNEADAFFSMAGREVFDFAVHRGSEVVSQLLERCGVDRAAVDWVVTHQANVNIIDAIAQRTGIARNRFFVNLDRLGNTAGASVLIALHELLRSGNVRPGQRIVLTAFGGGLSWGACLLQT